MTESRYLLMRLPISKVTWFYNSYILLEYQQLMNSWQDNLEEHTKVFLAITKQQIDYYLIHKEYIHIKKRSLMTFLENEKINLDKHFHQRSLNMLQGIQQLENSNVKSKVRTAIEESLKTVLAQVQNNQQNLHNSTFASALKGLKSGKMAYEGDELLPMLLNEIKLRTEKLKNLTSKEEGIEFGLTNDQKKILINRDHTQKMEYLMKAPELSSASVKNSQLYLGVTERMKARINNNFK